MNLHAAQRFLAGRKDYLDVTPKIDGHEWVTDRFVAVRRDQLPDSFKVEPVAYGDAGWGKHATRSMQDVLRKARQTLGPARHVRTVEDGVGELSILSTGPLMVAVNARRLSGMPGTLHITTNGLIAGFLPDAKGVPRLASVLMPVTPCRVFPFTVGSEKP